MRIVILYISTVAFLVSLLTGLLGEAALLGLLLRSLSIYIAFLLIGHLFSCLWERAEIKAERQQAGQANQISSNTDAAFNSQEALTALKGRPRETARIIDTLIDR